MNVELPDGVADDSADGAPPPFSGALPEPVAPGEIDLHLFNEGRHRRLWEMLGAHLLPGGGATFAVWAPNARRIRVLGDW